MASIIKLKRSTTPGAAPGSLATGEIALNLPDQILYTYDGSNVVRVGGKALANTNAYIASVAATERAALANTNARIDALTAGGNLTTNAYVTSTYVANAVFQSALANTNAYIGTKLNSSSYTAADVLSKLTTVDGASSGLDADLLDGQQGTYYATATSVSSLSSTVSTNAATELSHLANTNAYIASVQSDVDANEATERAALANTNAYIATKLASADYTASDVLTKIKTVDGASSGLDADLLDGQQGTYYATATSVSTNAATELAHLANTNSYIVSVQSDVDANEATERAALANTNAYIATKADAASPSTSGFFNHTGRLTVGTNLLVSGNTHIDGNLTVEGGVTYISSSTLNVDDSMIKLAANNAADTVDTGAYGKYVESATTKYAGYFRDATDGVFKFYASLESEPTTTVNTGGTGYALAQVDAIIDGGTY